MTNIPRVCTLRSWGANKGASKRTRTSDCPNPYSTFSYTHARYAQSYHSLPRWAPPNRILKKLCTLSSSRRSSCNLGGSNNSASRSRVSTDLCNDCLLHRWKTIQSPNGPLDRITLVQNAVKGGVTIVQTLGMGFFIVKAMARKRVTKLLLLTSFDTEFGLCIFQRWTPKFDHGAERGSTRDFLLHVIIPTWITLQKLPDEFRGVLATFSAKTAKMKKCKTPGIALCFNMGADRSPMFLLIVQLLKRSKKFLLFMIFFQYAINSAWTPNIVYGIVHRD